MATTEEAFFQRRLQSLPAFRTNPRRPELPSVKPPVLENLIITAPAPSPVTAEDLIEYAELRVRERALRTPRKRGDRVQFGDEVFIDVLGYSGGRLIPFSARGKVRVDVGAGEILPWLDEALSECSVGDGLELPVTLPDDYTVESLRGADATFLIDVTGANAVEAPDQDSARFRELLGPLDTLDGAMSIAADELEAERVAEAWEEARERVLDEVAQRTLVDLPEDMVDEEIRGDWQRVEAPFLLSREFQADEQQQALGNWLNDGPTRVDAERRLRLALGLYAIADAQKLKVDEKAVALVADLARTKFEVPEAQLEKGFSQTDLHPQLARLALHLRALELVLSKASVRFEGVDETFSLLPRK